GLSTFPIRRAVGIPAVRSALAMGEVVQRAGRLFYALTNTKPKSNGSASSEPASARKRRFSFPFVISGKFTFDPAVLYDRLDRVEILPPNLSLSARFVFKGFIFRTGRRLRGQSYFGHSNRTLQSRPSRNGSGPCSGIERRPAGLPLGQSAESPFRGPFATALGARGPVYRPDAL